MHLQHRTQKIFVAGHRGLVGSAVVRRLRCQGFENLLLRTRQEVDLRDAGATARLFEQERPAFVVLAAARVGGILANSRYPVPFIEENLAIELNVIRAAHAVGVRRLIFLGSSCIYPREAPQPLKEEYLLKGPLEETNAWYAVAKIAGIKLCQAYRRQYGSDFVTLMPSNVYGPGDNFDLETSHVLPALLRKFHEARREDDVIDAPVTVWGSGRPRREFVYADDLADACLFVLQTPEEDLWRRAPDGMLNVGTGRDLTIRALAELIRDVVGSRSPLVFDPTKPDGTPRKVLDVSRLAALGWRARTPLREGLARVYAWYRQEYEAHQIETSRQA